MNQERIVKKITAILFVLLLAVGFFKSGFDFILQRLTGYLSQEEDFQSLKAQLSYGTLETEFASGLWKRQEFIDFNGAMAKRLHMRGFYNDIGIYVTDDYYIISPYEYTTTDYEYAETTAFSDFLKANGIQLLYVNKPIKYTDDAVFRTEFGISSYGNQNADLFLSRIREAGIAALDLRDSLREEGIAVSDLFYRTDHHWTTKAALWAAGAIAEGLNEYCGCQIDVSLYDPSNYTFREWKECWLGEQGQKVSQAYVGLDDYTEIKPNFPTSYLFKWGGGEYDGTFDDFINESFYRTEDNAPEITASWHYSYQAHNCVNKNAAAGKLLVIGDSYDQVTVPFLSLGVHEIDFLALRDCDETFDLKQHILENEYDTVLICYAQFMLGAHDDPSSANYRMFSFGCRPPS